MAPKPHALSLPEVAFRVARHLGVDDFIACSLVCRTFHDSFAPYLWGDIQLGLFSTLQKRGKRLQEPLTRLISFETDAADYHRQGQPPREDRILQFLQRIAPWIRSLAIHSHHSSRQLRLGNQCTNINTLLIAAPPFNGQFGEDYWNDCEALVQQNSTYLRSLTLVRWGVGYDLPSPRLAPRRPLWTPLITCAQHTNISLRIQSGRIHGHDLDAFWKICLQLEILELTEVDLMELPTLHDTIPTNTLTPPTIRFPKLRELTLAKVNLKPHDQMEYFVLCSPMLHALDWCLKLQYFPMAESCSYFGSQAWPLLESLKISGQTNRLSGPELVLLLESTKRHFKRLDLNLGTAEEQVFTLLRGGGHFASLTMVDLTLSTPIQELLAIEGTLSIKVMVAKASKRFREVLESCPLLEHIVATTINGQDIIDSKPWACCRLKKFETMIHMGFRRRWRMDASYTESEKRQCHLVFKRLSQLKQLKVLNLSWPDYDHLQQLRPMPLPLELEMGLRRLSTLTDLEQFGYRGAPEIRLTDIEWMLQHWSKLRKITGGRPAMKRSKASGVAFVRFHLFMESLKAQGVETPEDWLDHDRDTKWFMDRQVPRIGTLASTAYESDSDSESESEMDE